MFRRSVIAKVFRQADTDERGTVDTGVVPSLAAKVLGSNVRETEMHLIRYKAEQKAAGGCILKHGHECLLMNAQRSL